MEARLNEQRGLINPISQNAELFWGIRLQNYLGLFLSKERNRPRVVIVGAGFGGLAAARQLGRADVDLTVLDHTNHHLFQPLLYQVATAALAPSDITGAIRHILRRQRNTTVLLADAQGIDTIRRLVRCHNGLDVPYDYLILATGTRRDRKFNRGRSSIWRDRKFNRGRSSIWRTYGAIADPARAAGRAAA